MTENEAIKKHIEECKHRIETIQGYVKRSEDANKKECETNIYILESTIQALEENQQYRAIGTIEEFKALKEKSVAKKPIDKEIYLECPACGNLVTEDSYCQCGQYVK